MRNTWILARNTFREAVRDRLLTTVLVFGGILVTGSVVLAPLTLGEQDRVIRDLGLSAVSAFTLLLIVLVGTGMVHREIDRRTIETILSQPVDRAHFILGKFFGMYASVLVSFFVLSAVYLAVATLFGGGFRWHLLEALWLVAVEAFVVTAIAILFSAVASPLLSAVFTSLVFVAGHLADDLRLLAEQSGNGAVAAASQFAYVLLPALHHFDVRNNVVSGVPVPPDQILGCTAYSILYAGAVLVVTIVVFHRRDFE